MAENTTPRGRKNITALLDAQFTGTNEARELPLSSLEDIYDSQKTEFFTVEHKQNDT